MTNNHKPATIKDVKDILYDFFEQVLAPHFEEHVEKRFDKVEKRLDNIGEHQDEHDRRFDKLDDRLDRHGMMLESHEEKLKKYPARPLVA